jgi:glutathione S-transferase
VSDLTIYGTPISPYVRTVRMCLEEFEEDYRMYEYMPGSDEQKEVHPFGKVPAIRDADLHLYETLAICMYIDEEYRVSQGLVPKDSVERADMFQRISIYMDEGYPSMIAGCFIPGALRPMLGKPARPADVEENLPRAEKYLSVADKELQGQRWMVGEDMSLADLFLAPAIYLFKMMPEGDKMLHQFQNLGAWYTNMTTVQSFKDTAPKPPGS